MYIIGTVKEVYGTNFGTAYQTYKESCKTYLSIRLQGVTDYLNSRPDIHDKFKPETYNSFVSPEAGFEFEIDIMDVLARDVSDGIRYGLCALAKFSKMVSVIPLKNRSPTETIRGLKLIFGKLGKPTQLYSDGESSLRSQYVFRFMN